MKLEQKQKVWISQLIFDNVKYNETYLEVLDHVISSLEAEEDENITFYQKLNQIWDEGFGGYENLPNLESQREKMVNNQIGKRHLEIFKSYFRMPLVTATLTLSLLFLFISNLYLSNGTLLLIMFSCALIPNLVNLIMYLKLKKYNLIKPSIRDEKISRSGNLFFDIFYFSIFVPIILAHYFFDFSFKLEEVYTPFFVIAIVIFTIQFLSYFKLYKENFKMEVSK